MIKIDKENKILEKEVKDKNGATYKKEVTATCGIIMPISGNELYSEAHWLNVRKIIIEAIGDIKEVKFSTKMVSDEENVFIIIKTIIQNIYSDDVVVCDISNRNPNVMFELGMRLAFNKPVVIIKDDLSTIPFDIAHIKCLTYPKSLAYYDILIFKKNLQTAVLSMYNEKFDFLKEFGNYKVAKIEEQKLDLEYVVDLIKGLSSDVRRVPEQMRRLEQIEKRPKSIGGYHNMNMLELLNDISQVVDVPTSKLKELSGEVLSDLAYKALGIELEPSEFEKYFKLSSKF